MQPITRIELLKILDDYLKKDIVLKVAGYIDLKIKLKEFEYKLDADQIYLKSNADKNYIVVNLNSVNFMGEDGNKIIFHIDDGKDTIIIIEK